MHTFGIEAVILKRTFVLFVNAIFIFTSLFWYLPVHAAADVDLVLSPLIYDEAENLILFSIENTSVEDVGPYMFVAEFFADAEMTQAVPHPDSGGAFNVILLSHAAGETKNLSVEPPTEAIAVRVIVDSENDVVELNEENNVATLTASEPSSGGGSGSGGGSFDGQDIGIRDAVYFNETGEAVVTVANESSQEADVVVTVHAQWFDAEGNGLGQITIGRVDQGPLGSQYETTIVGPLGSVPEAAVAILFSLEVTPQSGEFTDEREENNFFFLPLKNMDFLVENLSVQNNIVSFNAVNWGSDPSDGIVSIQVEYFDREGNLLGSLSNGRELDADGEAAVAFPFLEGQEDDIYRIVVTIDDQNEFFEVNEENNTAGFIILSDDATLSPDSEATFEGVATLPLEFDEFNEAHIDVGEEAQSVSFSLFPNDAFASSISVEGIHVFEQETAPEFTLWSGRNTFDIVVTAENTLIEEVYTVIIDRTVAGQPTAEDVSFTMAEDTVLTGVLEGAGAEGHELAFDVSVNVDTGELTLLEDGSFTYEPALDETGTQTFQFRVKDDAGRESFPATVTIEITPVNDAPVVNDESFQIEENGSLFHWIESEDAEGDDLTFRLIEGPLHGELPGVALGDEFFPFLYYVPDDGFVGHDSFRYVANDGTVDSQPATVQVEVTDALPDFTYPTIILENGMMFVWLNNDGGSAQEDIPLVLQWVDGEGIVLEQSDALLLPSFVRDVMVAIPPSVIADFSRDIPEQANLLRVVVDPENVIDESDEENNAESTTREFLLPDLTLWGTLWGKGGGGQWGDGFFRSGLLSFNIHNLGWAEVQTTDVLVEWLNDAQEVVGEAVRYTALDLSQEGRFAQINDLLGNESLLTDSWWLDEDVLFITNTVLPSHFRADLDASLVPDAVSVRITLDPDNAIVEADEEDNVFVLPIQTDAPFLSTVSDQNGLGLADIFDPGILSYIRFVPQDTESVTMVPVVNGDGGVVTVIYTEESGEEKLEREIASGEPVTVPMIPEQGNFVRFVLSEGTEHELSYDIQFLFEDDQIPAEDEEEENEQEDENGSGDNNNGQNQNQNQNQQPVAPAPSSGGGGGGFGPSTPVGVLVNQPLQVIPGRQGTVRRTFTNGAAVEVAVPGNAVSQNAVFTVRGDGLSTDTAPASASAVLVGNQVFHIDAVNGAQQAITQFNADLSFVFTLPDGTDAAGQDIGVYFYDAASRAWTRVPNITVQGRTVRFTQNHLTTFAVFSVNGTPDTLPVDVAQAPQQVLGERVEGCALDAGSVYKTANDAAVWYITADCTRRPFRKSFVYFTYFDSWSAVQTVNAEKLAPVAVDDLGFMPWGPLYDPKYGAIVKTVDDPKVYLLLNGERYWINSPEVFEGLFYQWNWIEDVDTRLLEKYTLGNEITYTDEHLQGTIVKYENDPKVYLLEGDGARGPGVTTVGRMIKRHIANETAFNKLGFRWDRIVTIPDTETYGDALQQ